MLQDKRLETIIQYLMKNERIDIETVCELNQVSKDTARRDLIKLEELRQVIRIRGGAKRPQLHNEVYRFDERMDMAIDSKKRIGKMAAHYIQDGDYLILDASTTVQALTPFIQSKRLTVVTNSIDVAGQLSIQDEITVNLLGGSLSGQHRAIFGSRAIENLKDYKVNKCFIGTCGISAEGLSTSIEEEGLLVRQMIKRAEQVIVLADSSKFHKTFFQKVCPLEDIDIVITEKEMDKSFEAILEQHGIEIVIASA